MESFISERLPEKESKSFYDPLKKMKRNTFTSMQNSMEYNCKDKMVTIKAERNILRNCNNSTKSKNIHLACCLVFSRGRGHCKDTEIVCRSTGELTITFL